MREQEKGLRSGGGNWDTKAILQTRQEPLMLGSIFGEKAEGVRKRIRGRDWDQDLIKMRNQELREQEKG